MLSHYQQLINTYLPNQSFDTLGVGVVDFNTQKYEMLEAHYKDGQTIFSDPHFIYDLASVTKILTNSLAYFLDSNNFNEELIACLEHRAGLPAWGLLSRSNWKEQILSYEIMKESETLYSDFSALRVMLEFNKKSTTSMKELCSKVWDSETVFWKDLKSIEDCVYTGHRHGEVICGEVHDPNAYVINEFTSHAGLFSTLEGVCKTMLNYADQTSLFSFMIEHLENYPHRFLRGWDRVQNLTNTLAPKDCSVLTAGHLGFTGQSVWIDFQKQKGVILLSNATKNYWYDKSALNEVRKNSLFGE